MTDTINSFIDNLIRESVAAVCTQSMPCTASVTGALSDETSESGLTDASFTTADQLSNPTLTIDQSEQNNESHDPLITPEMIKSDELNNMVQQRQSDKALDQDAAMAILACIDGIPAPLSEYVTPSVFLPPMQTEYEEPSPIITISEEAEIKQLWKSPRSPKQENQPVIGADMESLKYDLEKSLNSIQYETIMEVDSIYSETEDQQKSDAGRHEVSDPAKQITPSGDEVQVTERLAGSDVQSDIPITYQTPKNKSPCEFLPDQCPNQRPAGLLAIGMCQNFDSPISDETISEDMPSDEIIGAARTEAHNKSTSQDTSDTSGNTISQPDSPGQGHHIPTHNQNDMPLNERFLETGSPRLLRSGQSSVRSTPSSEQR